MTLFQIVSVIVLPILAIIIVLFLLMTNPLLTKGQTKLFLSAAIVCLVAIFAASIDAYFERYVVSYSYLVRRITSFLTFSLSPIAPLLFYLIFRRNEKTLLILIPACVNVALSFISMFAKVIFYFGPPNSYARGPLFFLPFLVAAFYLIMMFVSGNNVNSKSKKQERLFLVIIFIMLACCISMEILHGYKFLMWGCTALSILSYFSLMYVMQFTVDPLTGVYNRQMYQKMLGQVSNSNHAVIANLDINYLKKVNDKFGHKKGDALLCSFCKIINKYLARFSSFYRVGGDEFVLISKKLAFKEMVILLEETQKIAKTRNISFAFGVVEYNRGDDIDVVLQCADELMYENKRMIKLEDSQQSKLKEE